MKRLVLAVAASAAVHGALFAALLSAPPPTRPIRTSSLEQPEVTELMPIDLRAAPAAAAPSESPRPTAVRVPATAQQRPAASANAAPWGDRAPAEARPEERAPVAAAQSGAAGDVDPESPTGAEPENGSAAEKGDAVSASKVEADHDAATGGAPPHASSADPSGGATLDVQALHERLAASARRCAPSTGRRRGSIARGAVATVRFCADAGGQVGDVALLASSGSQPLDDAARRCVVQGALPLPVNRGCYEVPIRFGD